MTKLRGNPWAVLVVVSLGFFMTLLDLTIVNIAIPNMIDKLHASLDDVLWVLNAYALVLAVLVITAGRLGDLLGPRTMFVAGIAVFTAASAACGFAPNPAWLIAFRAVQGIGAAMLMPQTLAIVTMTFPPERRGAAFGIWGAVAGLATIAGPTLGGLLVTAFDWRWIFFVNLPIGAAVLAVTFFIIPGFQPGRRHRFDIAGVGLASLALLAICYGLVEGQRYDWGTVTSFVSIPLVLAVGVALLGVFLLVQKARQDREPLVPFVLFRSRNFTLMNWVSGTLSIGMLGIFLPFTIYLQSALGFSALKAGLTMAPSSVVMIILAPVLGRLTDKIGGKYILMTGLTLFAVGMGWAVLIATPHSAWYDFLAPMIVAGLGMGGTFPPMTTTAMRDVDPRMAGAASGVLNTTRQVGSVIGTAAVGALLQNRLVSSLTGQATVASAALPPQARGPFVSGFRKAASSGLIGGAPSGSAAPAGTSPGLAAQLRRLGAEVFGQGYVHAMRWTMVLPIAVVLLAAASCLALRNGAADHGDAAAAAADSGQMAGTISSPGSPGSLGQSPGSSSGTAS
ncbi:MAG TPA: DHA2 family efflux MFS transporter permease subunit [Streptosporangiaceae bacterium]|nr:DHA2 family efflux MFS transporter permease subunit [Streptosporangiaceae bacterium]